MIFRTPEFNMINLGVLGVRRSVYLPIKNIIISIGGCLTYAFVRMGGSQYLSCAAGIFNIYLSDYG